MNIVRVRSIEINKWLIESLKLSPYQIEKLKLERIVENSGYYFFKEENSKKTSLLWRLTFPFFVIYNLLILIFFPINFMISGKWKYSLKLYNNCYKPWAKQFNL